MGLLEERRAQHKARERNRGWGLAISGRSPIVSPMYGDRQAGRRQGSITIEPPNGRHVTLQIPAQTWDGPFDFGTQALQDLGWSGSEPLTGLSTEAKAPATGYYDLHLDLDTTEADDVTLTLEVDGQARWSKTLNVFLSLNGVLPVGEWRRGQTLRLLSNKPVSVSWGRVTMQLVEPQVGHVGEAGPTAEDWTSDPSHETTVPLSTQPGDLLIGWHVTYSHYDETSHSPPAGWTEVASDLMAAGSRRVRASVYSRVAESGDDGTPVTFPFSGHSGEEFVAIARTVGASAVVSTVADYTLNGNASAPLEGEGLLLVVGWAVRNAAGSDPPPWPTLSSPSGGTQRTEAAPTGHDARGRGWSFEGEVDGVTVVAWDGVSPLNAVLSAVLL